MALREDLIRRIERKQAELSEAEIEWGKTKAGAAAYIQALQEILKTLPRDAASGGAETILRKGGALARVRELILARRSPQDVSSILAMLKKPDDKKSRASITSALGSYARRGEVFVRTAPNTFGLIELGHAQTIADEPPADFGRLEPADLLEPGPDDTELFEDTPASDDDDEAPF